MEYALITGGTSGIGFELARNFAASGYGVIIVSSSSERLQKARQKLKDSYDVKVLEYQQDMRRIGAAAELYDRIKKNNINISILVNNAGVGLVGRTDEIDLQHDEGMLILNIINLVELSKLFIADMYRQGSGRILNVASTGAFLPGPYTSTYYASKAFVLSYSRAIRYEARGKGIQVCTLCPGATKTEFFSREGVNVPRIAMTSEEVARYAYKRFMKNKEIIIPGIINKLQASRWVPVKLKMKIVENMKNQKVKNQG
ncbi:MAG: SDR family oxidoreductase [Bacillota bacterium]|nr:SDR family oxidoreductase [Bacillota bacterium]